MHVPHGKVKNIKRISRIVTIPDYQGVGIGTSLMNYLAKYYTDKNYRFTITTTTPALIHSLKKSDTWKLKRQGREIARSNKSKIEQNKRRNGSDSSARLTTSWEYKK